MDTEPDVVTALAQATLQRIETLIGEVDALDAVWKQRLQILTRLERRDLPDFLPGWHDFIVTIKGIARSVKRLIAERTAFKLQGPVDPHDTAREEQDRRDMAKIRSCGFQPHQLQWDAIKRTRGLLAFQRRFSYKTGELGPTVDAVVELGREWLKVFQTMTERKLHLQMAEEGWHPDDSSDDESDYSDGEESGIQIISMTAQLVKAARANRCSTRIPTIRLALPNITLGESPAFEKLFNRVRSLGISKGREGNVEILVDCADSDFLQRPIPPLEEVWENFFSDTNKDRLTPTLNLELTLILSLASDITHEGVEPQVWYSRQTLSHIEDELHAPGVRLSSVYSVLQGRSLECTQLVAREVRNVVDDLGTDTTKARTAVLFGRQSVGDIDTLRTQTHGTGTASAESDAASKEIERKRLVSELRRLSKYPVPDSLQLPIQVVGKDEFDPEDYQSLIEAGKLPSVAVKVSANLDRLYNRSCHLWGWLQDITTVSANLLTVRMIEATVDKNRSSGMENGPRLYVTPLAISINTARPCPNDKWEEIKESKHLRKEARSKEAKNLKASGAWGPSLGLSITWDQKKVRGHQSQQKAGSSTPSDG